MLVASALLATGHSSLAQPASDDRAAAAALFDEGRRLMDRGEYAEACPKLEESLRLVAGVGTRFNLAECNERSGKLASAWLLYREVTGEMARAHDAAREKAARARMEALEPRLAKLRIDVAGRVPGLTVRRDGRPVNEPLWGTPIPVDPGMWRIEASAPGYQSRRYVVEVRAEGETVGVRVEPLELASGSADGANSTDNGTDDDDDASTALSTAGWATFGTGLGVGAVGGVLLGVGMSKIGEADDLCGGRSECSSSVADLGNEGRELGLAGEILIGIGGVGVLTGAILLIVSAVDEESVDDAPGAATGEARRKQPRPRISATVGPTSARLEVSF